MLAAGGTQAEERGRHLLAPGRKPAGQGRARGVSRLPEPLQQRAGEQWQRLEWLLQQCRRQNELNGRLLAGQIETINTLLGQESSYGKQEHFSD